MGQELGVGTGKWLGTGNRELGTGTEEPELGTGMREDGKVFRCRVRGSSGFVGGAASDPCAGKEGLLNKQPGSPRNEGRKNKRGLKNQRVRARFKRGLGKPRRTAYPSRVRLKDNYEYT